MRIVRWRPETDGPPAWGWIDGDRVGRLEGSPFGEYRRNAGSVPLEAARLLPPLKPGKIICVGRNFPLHAAEHDAEVPSWPLLFFKPPTAVIADGEAIRLPPQSRQVEHEAEQCDSIRHWRRADLRGCPGRNGWHFPLCMVGNPNCHDWRREMDDPSSEGRVGLC